MARPLDLATLERLRQMARDGDRHAELALGQLKEIRDAPLRSRTRRNRRRAFERHAARALGQPASNPTYDPFKE